MVLLGIDIGSSSIKASLLDAKTGACIGSAQSPDTEMLISAPKPGWAEQDPETWFEHVLKAMNMAVSKAGIDSKSISAIGISYQMHGLVCIDKSGNVLRPSIIWCDSRAVEHGQKAFSDLGSEKCLSHLLNSPGNFTASKLKWVKENQPDLYNKIYKIMLPGDYIAYRLTDEINTTASGLSEGILWDFKESKAADFLMDYYGFNKDLLADQVPTFGIQGKVSENASKLFKLTKGIPVSYRAGDQPNNALSLNVLEPGEIAATAGTSGVVYGVSDSTQYDPQSRVNTFLHVNGTKENIRNGVLLCINGTGILNSWIRRNVSKELSYNEMNLAASATKPGAEGLLILPFGNGAERMLGNRELGCQIRNLNFNTHQHGHIIRAAHEGLAFAFYYGMEIMKSIGISSKVIRAGHANMFLSPIFRNALSALANVNIELYNTDGALGAAIGAGLGAGIFKDSKDAFKNLQVIEKISPNQELSEIYKNIYKQWAACLV
jgi:xylulokinase